MSRTRSPAALRRQPVPRHARRTSGPVRPVAVPGRPRPAVPTTQPHRFTSRLGALPDHRLLDTLLRSRAWIWLLGIALGGIVFMQVSLLGMNAGIGRAVAQSTALEHDNARLQEQVAELSSLELVRAAAAKLGLLSPDPGNVGYLTPRPGVDARRAAQHMTAPSEAARQAVATDGRSATTVTTPPVAATTTATTTTTTTPEAVPTAAATAAPPVTPEATAAPTVAPAATAVPPAPASATGATEAP